MTVCCAGWIGFQYFVNIYMFRAYLGPSSEGKPYVYNNWYLLFFLDDWNSNPIRTTDSHLKRISTNYCIRTVVSPVDRPRYARKMQRLSKYTRNKLCIKLGFVYTLTSNYVQLIVVAYSKLTQYKANWLLYVPLHSASINSTICSRIVISVFYTDLRIQH